MGFSVVPSTTKRGPRNSSMGVSFDAGAALDVFFDGAMVTFFTTASVGC